MGAPTSSKIIYAFDGSWTAALAATPGASAPDVTALRVRLGLTFTKAQIGNALRLFADSGAGNTVDHYEEWAAKAAAEDPSLAIPLANRTIIKRFGMHWENAINSVGIQSVRQLAEQRDYMHNGRRRTTREEVIDSLQRAYVAKGEPFHVACYAAWLREQRANPPEGEPPRNASVHAVQRHFGTWGLGVTAAVPGRRPRTPTCRPGWSDRDLLEAFQACRDDLGHAPTSTQYRGWCTRQSASRPTWQTIARRLGVEKWSDVPARVHELEAIDDAF